MKRFWTAVSVEAEEPGWGIRLDGRPLRTPARAPLVVPTRVLAEAIEEEWAAVADTVDPRAMPMTGIADAAIDRVAPDRHSFSANLGLYAEADLACYRAEAPRKLVALQEERWDPLLGWARRRFDVDFATTCGVMHVPQAKATVERLAHALAALDPFRLAAMSPLVTIGGSLLAALALLERAVSAEQAWAAVSLDDQWQLDQWGRDAEAEAALENRRRDFLAAARFLELLDA
ncbi:MAG TPA: ATP12 family protein [Sphingomicrobium sp.]|nr:ATP12 family protein [Sphingomicrobium sp.]